MNPINDEIPEKESQNSTILEAEEKIETIDCVESSKIIDSEIQKPNETKDMAITEKTEEDSIEKKVLGGQSNDNITEKKEKEALNTEEFNEKKSNREQPTDLKKITENTEVNHPNEESITKEQPDISEECKSQQNNFNAQECLKDCENSQDKKEETEDNKQSEDDKTSEDDKQSEDKTSDEDNTKSIEDNTKSKDITEPDSKDQLEKEISEEKKTKKSDFTTKEHKQQDGIVNDKNKELESGSESEGEYEDVEIPEEVEELIVPDEADAEDLTSCNGDDPDKSLNEDETTKDSEAEDATSCDGDDQGKNANEEKAEHENKKEGEEEDLTKDTEEEADINSLEPELVAMEEAVNKGASSNEDTTNDDDDVHAEDAIKNTTNDPLNCTTNQEQEEKECNDDDDENILSTENSDKNDDDTNDVDGENDINDVDDDDDEDEVQFVETRNSPICIESDDDDDTLETTNNTSITTNPKTNKHTITTPTATITVPKNIIVTRTSARKSTAKPQQVAPVAAATKTSNSKTVPQIQNKSKNFSYLEKATNYKRSSTAKQQKVVDCIELLDSSDEESSASHYRPSSTMQLRTPQKRTLLAAKVNNNKNSNKNFNSRGQLPTNFTPQIRKQTKKPAPLPLPPATPQSNFLNAVQLQPAVSGSNPPAFSALLSNKSVIIPNAFYGNPERGKTELDLERRYGRWLDNFLTQFCNPHLVVTHSCFVFLQKSLKYKDFARIKTIRSNMNSHAQTANEDLNHNLMVDLRTIMMKNNRDISTHGRRFCELTCKATGKPVTLLAHSVSGRVTLKTCNMDIPKASTSSSAAATSTAANSSTRKRQLEEEEDEYMPDKQKLKTIIQKPPSENGDSGETSEDRKRSLRTKRTKRLDNSFSYNEDELLAEFEIDDEEEAAEKEVQRKINQKRLEAQQQREQQVKSFESAFIQAFAKSSDGPTSSSSSRSTRNASNQRLRLANSATSTATTVQKYTANNDTEDLLQATWVDNEDTQIISDDDEPKVHRIYKKQEQQQYQQFLQQQLEQQELEEQYLTTPKLPTKYNTTPKTRGKYNKRQQQQQQEEIITGDDDYIENDNFYNNAPANIDISQFPPNIDREMHVNGKFKDKCVICNINCQRIVHHYVNEHRGSEVYNSRLTSSQIHLLRQGNCSDSIMSMYKNGQPQYEAYCIFCQKKSRFMLPYWFQHFTMHTGEYAYRCSGCGIRKPTRSLLTQHQGQGCPEDGSTVQDYSHDAKSSKVEARVCTLCNYVQLHRGNIVKHLHQQHGIGQILPKHIQTIVLLKTPSTKSSSSSSSTTMSSLNSAMRRRKPPVSYNQSSSSSSSSAQNTYIIDDDDPDFIMEQQESGQSLSPTEDTQNHYYNYIPPYMQAGNSAANFTWAENDPEDLSFMICGMLDVQMNADGN